MDCHSDSEEAEPRGEAGAEEGCARAAARPVAERGLQRSVRVVAVPLGGGVAVHLWAEAPRGSASWFYLPRGRACEAEAERRAREALRAWDEADGFCARLDDALAAVVCPTAHEAAALATHLAAGGPPPAAAEWAAGVRQGCVSSERGGVLVKTVPLGEELLLQWRAASGRAAQVRSRTVRPAELFADSGAGWERLCGPLATLDAVRPPWGNAKAPLAAVPPDALAHALSYLDADGVAAAARACRALRHAHRAEFLWRELCARELRVTEAGALGWRAEYAARRLAAAAAAAAARRQRRIRNRHAEEWPLALRPLIP